MIKKTTSHLLLQRYCRIYPCFTRSFCLYLSENTVRIIVLTKDRLTIHPRVNASDIHKVQRLLKRGGWIPIYIIIDFSLFWRLLPLAGLGRLKRYLYLRQAYAQEFDPEHWVGGYGHRSFYSLAAVGRSSVVQSHVSFLRRQTNPVAHINTWPATLAQWIFKHFGNSPEWSLIIARNPAHQWQILICRWQLVLLMRQGFISEKELFSEAEAHKEVTSTLRYLERYGYRDGMWLALYLVGVPERGVTWPAHLIIRRLDVQWQQILYSLLTASTLTLFSPFKAKDLYPHVLAWQLSRALLWFGMPLIGFLMVVLLALQTAIYPKKKQLMQAQQDIAQLILANTCNQQNTPDQQLLLKRYKDMVEYLATQAKLLTVVKNLAICKFSWSCDKGGEEWNLSLKKAEASFLAQNLKTLKQILPEYDNVNNVRIEESSSALTVIRIKKSIAIK